MKNKEIAFKKKESLRIGVIAWISFYCCLCYGLYLYFVFPLNAVALEKFAGEDRILETLGAIYFFVSSLLFFLLFKRDNNGNKLGKLKTKKNIIYLLLGILFLFAAGEEISWGQRIFNVEVADSWKAINVQDELNIHNLALMEVDLLNLNYLFPRLSIIFFFLLPLACKFSLKFSGGIKRLGFPLVPIEIGGFFCITYLIDKCIVFWLVFKMISYNLLSSGENYTFLKKAFIDSHQEISEHVWAFLLLTIAIYWIYENKVLKEKTCS